MNRGCGLLERCQSVRTKCRNFLCGELGYNSAHEKQCVRWGTNRQLRITFSLFGNGKHNASTLCYDTKVTTNVTPLVKNT